MDERTKKEKELLELYNTLDAESQAETIMLILLMLYSPGFNEEFRAAIPENDFVPPYEIARGLIKKWSKDLAGHKVDSCTVPVAC